MGHFYFVRHGQTIWNVENKICGATDIALTEFGHQQAVETGEKILIDGIQADEILYSPLVRAADTAKHISEMTGIPARPEPRLAQRIYNLLDEIREESDEKTYILVAHNGIARVVQSYFHDMTNEEYAAFGVKNCEIVRYDFPEK